MYEVTGWHKYGERDDPEHGCDPDRYVSYGGDQRWSAATIPYLLTQLRSFVGVDEDYEIELDACEEDGRVDISVVETVDSYPANARDIQRWKDGNLELWYSTYTFYVEEVTRKPAWLKGEMKCES